MEQELEAIYWNDAMNLISTTAYSITCKFDALTNMEELQIQKLSDLPNNHLIFIFKLHTSYNESPYWIWRLQPNGSLICPSRVILQQELSLPLQSYPIKYSC
jgi:hypothetical protein